MIGQIDAKILPEPPMLIFWVSAINFRFCYKLFSNPQPKTQGISFLLSFLPVSFSYLKDNLIQTSDKPYTYVKTHLLELHILDTNALKQLSYANIDVLLTLLLKNEQHLIIN